MDNEKSSQREGSSLYDMHTAVLRAFHAQRALLRPYGDTLGLGPGQPKVLSYLAARGTSTQRDIAVYFAVDAAAVSRMLDTLARKGMVTVAPAETDRRAKAVTLTEAGHETVRAWDERCAEVEQIMLDGIDEADRAQLEELLERVRANLVAARRGRDAACGSLRLASARGGERA